MMQGKCVMAHPSDMAPALMALEAKAVIATSDEERRIPLAEFFTGPNSFKETALDPGELLVAFEIPDQNGMHQVFIKQRIRHAADFALSSVAVSARVTKGVCEDIKVLLGGVAPVPYVVAELEDMIKGRRLNEQLVSQAADVAVKEARPLPMNGYKVDLTKALVKRALTTMMEPPM